MGANKEFLRSHVRLRFDGWQFTCDLGYSLLLLPRCVIIYFNTCIENRAFQVSSEASHSSGRKRLAAGGREHSLQLWKLDISELPSTFHSKKALFLHLLKKVLCVTREQLTFLDSDDDFKHACTTRAQSSSSQEESQLSSLIAQCLYSSYAPAGQIPI